MNPTASDSFLAINQSVKTSPDRASGMATLQKFKLLATPQRSPSRSSAAATCLLVPLKELFRGSSLRRLIPRRRRSGDDLVEERGLIGHSLKDLFLSSPPPSGSGGDGCGGGDGRRFLLEGFAAGSVGGGMRRGSAGLRYRLLRGKSRSVLFTIAE